MHPHHHGKALHPVSIVLHHLLLLGDTLEDFSDLMPYLKLALHVLLTLDGDEILYLPELSL